MPGVRPFTPLDLQLVLLRRMADFQPGLVEAARRDLGVSLAEQREANRRWQAMVRAPRSRGAAARYRSVLGAPETRARRRIGDLDCEALLWPLPLWPSLRFEVLLVPGGVVANEWLVRAPGVPGPRLRSVADLRPWSCTVDEVARAFAPARPLEGTAPTRWRLAFTAPAPQDTGGDAGAGAEAEAARETEAAGEGEAEAAREAEAAGEGEAEAAGEAVRKSWVADFTWGLLQEVTPVEAGPG